MRENTPDLAVEIRRTARQRRPDDDGEYETVEVAVPVVNPQSRTRDTHVDGESIVGEIPVTDAETPCADERLDAAAITVLEDRVTTYYPRGDTLVAFAWDATVDEWECDERELDASFDVDEDRFDDEEAVVWTRDERERREE